MASVSGKYRPEYIITNDGLSNEGTDQVAARLQCDPTLGMVAMGGQLEEATLELRSEVSKGGGDRSRKLKWLKRAEGLGCREGSQ